MIMGIVKFLAMQVRLKKMTLADVKAKHPDLYDAVVEELEKVNLVK